MKVSTVTMAYESIRDKILSRELVPGDYLVELKLAEEFNMSRTPIREAIKMLKQDGLVESIPKKCTFVKPTVQSESIMAYEFSEALDGMVAYLVADRIARGSLEQRDLDTLWNYTNDLDHHLEKNDLKKWGEKDRLFHMTLVQMCENNLIINASQTNSAHINEVLWFRVLPDLDKVESNQMHRMLLETLVAGDREKSREIAQLHRRRIILAINN